MEILLFLPLFQLPLILNENIVNIGSTKATMAFFLLIKPLPINTSLFKPPLEGRRVSWEEENWAEEGG